MFKIIVPPNIILHCKRVLEHHNFGKRGYADGMPEQQLTGIIGQSCIMNEFGLPPVEGSRGFDGGKDLEFDGLIIDVKTMGRTTDVAPYYVNNFLAVQKKYKTDIYIFCSYHKIKHEITVCGWVDKIKFDTVASFFKKGTIRYRSDGTSFRTFHDLYEIENSSLNDSSSILILKEQLLSYKKNKL